MVKIKCVAIDDEPIALSIIRKYCEEYGEIELMCFDSPLEGMKYVTENHPDIVFLDIEMQPVNGLDLARKLPENVCLIFTTAYRQYALDGFDLNAVDYIQKPLLYPRFVQAMVKAKRWLKTEDEVLELNVEHQKVNIKLTDILYVEAMDNYVKVHRENLPTVITLMSMKEINDILPSDKFIRVHRSYIVSLRKIESTGSKGVILRGINNAIPIGRTYWKHYRERSNGQI